MSAPRRGAMPGAAASAAPLPAKSRRRMSHLRDVAYRTCGYLSMLSFGLRALAFPCEREWGSVVRSARPPTTGGKPRACREEATPDDLLRPARLAVCRGLGRSGFVITRLRGTGVMTVPEYLARRYTRGVRVLAGVLMAVGGSLNLGIFPLIEARFLALITRAA